MASWLATWLDEDFLTERGVTILPALRPGRTLPPPRSGAEVAAELGGRKLLRYLTPAQVGSFRNGSRDRNFATPTPYPADQTMAWLLPPRAEIPRRFVLILRPERIPWIQGPLWVATGRAIQYILPEGFPADAIVVPGTLGEPGDAWEIGVS